MVNAQKNNLSTANFEELKKCTTDEGKDQFGFSKESSGALNAISWGLKYGLYNGMYSGQSTTNKNRKAYEYIFDGQGPKMFFTDPELILSFASLYLNRFNDELSKDQHRKFAITSPLENSFSDLALHRISTFKKTSATNQKLKGFTFCEIQDTFPVQASVVIKFDSIPNSSNNKIPAGSIFT